MKNILLNVFNKSIQLCHIFHLTPSTANLQKLYILDEVLGHFIGTSLTNSSILFWSHYKMIS